MSQAGGVPLATWLAAFRVLRAWHRYEVRGLEPLLEPGAKLIVAYHGRPLALDQCMLTVSLHERLGYLPHGIIHGYFGQNRLLKAWIDGLGFVTGDGPGIEQAVARGEHILVQPGGTREGCRSFRHRYEVDWGERVGYLRLAIRYRLPIVPVAAMGVDDFYIGLNDGYALSRRLRVPAGIPVWLGIGPTGVWPLSLSFPVKVTQLVGAPIHRHLDGGIDPSNKAALVALNQEVRDAVQSLMDRARGRKEAA